MKLEKVVGRRFVLLGLAAALAFACSKADTPADPVWGKEPCAHCKMLVGDKRYAAQVIHDGERLYFDDFGCMVLWLDEKGSGSTRAWVRDDAKGAWVDARTSLYEEGKKTPMDFGFEVASAGTVTFTAAADVVRKKKAHR